MKLHFIGIGGIGMSGLAKLLLLQNHEISGSDIAESEVLKNLEKMGALIHVNQRQENVPQGSTVVISSSIKEDNPELLVAKKWGLPILHRSDLLNILAKEKLDLAVAGSHGKTTTSALLVQVLNPSFAIGGMIKEQNSEHTNSPYFVFEACESDGTLVKYHPQGAIITNIDNDHLDHYKSLDNLQKTFQTFAAQVQNKEFLFVHEETGLEGIKYGFSPSSDLRATNVFIKDRKYHFDVSFKGKEYKDVCINSPLHHNVLNSLAVFGLSLQLEIDEQIIRNAFLNFSTPKKRMDIKYDSNETIFIDDYGHHPTEIASTLSSIRKAWPLHRLIVLFQPHRYSRMKICTAQFADTFKEADHLFVTEIYSAGEKPIEGVTSEELMKVIKIDAPIEHVFRNKLAETVYPLLRPYDVVVSFGAGDITYIHDEIKNRGKINPLKVALIYGGKSVEHEVSIRSSRHVLQGLTQEMIKPIQFYVDREGNWIQEGEKLTLGQAVESLKRCDAAFPMMHGKFGEDGLLQGMFEMLDIPYAGGPSAFNAICMDKAFTKMLSLYSGIATSPFVVVKKDIPFEIAEIESLEYPVFVKPVHLGSSIGVIRVEDRETLLKAIDYGFQLDNKLLIEKEIQGREIEYAMLEDAGCVHAFDPGEVLADGKMYTYEAKYSNDKFFHTDTRAELPKEVIEEGRKIAQKLFAMLDGRGYARIDFFLDKENKFWFNEVNPIPGFTNLSLYPQISSANGFSIQKLTAHLVAIGMHHTRQDRRLKNVAL